MKVFIDTAILEEIIEVRDLGILDGVTTNPTLVSKTGKPWKEAILEILKEVPDKPVSVEVIATDREGIKREAQILSELGENVVVKVPCTEDGLRAIFELNNEGAGVKTNVTLVFSPLQAMLAAKVGATYVSPFIGRVDDMSYDGMQVLEEIVAIYDVFGFDTEIIAASIRHVDHVRRCATLGADIATIPYKIIKQMYRHPLTDIGLSRFIEDAKKAGISI